MEHWVTAVGEDGCMGGWILLWWYLLAIMLRYLEIGLIYIGWHALAY